MTLRALVALIFLKSLLAFAGDDASGSILYELDISGSFKQYEMNDADAEWTRSLTTNLNYSGDVVYLVRTGLKLKVDGKDSVGKVYRAVNRENLFYVVEGDAMIQGNKDRPYSPGGGGFSMYSSPSRNFLVCLNFMGHGVPFLNTKRFDSKIVWYGTSHSRFSI